jgi:dolichyl-phosphate beta-glucosyltransferase
MIHLSVVIPAYNEEKRIEKTLVEVLNYFKEQEYTYEIIVVNDGSKDKTEQIIKKYSFKNKKLKLISYKPNHGKGYAVRTGILASKGEFILFSDADLSTPIQETERLLEAAKYCDVVIASRSVKESKIKTVFYRRLMGLVFVMFVKILAVPGINDTQCGFKMFRKAAALKLFNQQKIDGWAFDVEVLYLARKYGYKIQELGVKWQHFEHENVNPVLQSFKMFREIAKIRINDLKGIYK